MSYKFLFTRQHSLIINLSSFIIHDVVASCRHTPQSLRDSSPKLRRAITAYKLKATKSARFFDEKSKKS